MDPRGRLTLISGRGLTLLLDTPLPNMDPLLWLSAAAIVAALLFSIPFIQRLFLGKRGEIRPAQDGMIISTIKAMISIYG